MLGVATTPLFLKSPAWQGKWWLHVSSGKIVENLWRTTFGAACNLREQPNRTNMSAGFSQPAEK